MPAATLAASPSRTLAVGAVMSTEAVVGIAISGAIGAIVVGTLIFKAGGWHSRVNADLSTLKQFMDEIRGDIKDILRRLPPQPVTGESPLRLTDFGRELAADVGAEAWAERHAPTLRPRVAGLEPFEVDDLCAKYTHDSLDDDMSGAVARCAYEFGIERGAVLSVLRVVLRDALLQQRSTQSASGT